MGTAFFLLATAIFVIAFVFWTNWKEEKEGALAFQVRIGIKTCI